MFKSVKYLDGDMETCEKVTRPGKVSVQFENDDTFEGTYILNEKGDGLIRSGFGVYTWRSGGQYEGTYSNGKRDGNGTYKFPNGEVYTGQWINNLKSGKGKYTYSNGDYFEGVWVGDKRNGEGLFYNDTDKTEVTGIWRDGRLDVKTVNRKAVEEKKPPMETPKEEVDKKESMDGERSEHGDENQDEDNILKKTSEKEEEVVEKTEDVDVVEEPKKEEKKPIQEPDQPEVEENNAQEVEQEQEDKDVAKLDKAEAEASDDVENDKEEDLDVLAPSSAVKEDKKEVEEQKRPTIVVLGGGPASGKGTQCQKLADKYGFIHISTGQLLRNEIEAETELGLKAKEHIGYGKLVDDEIVVEVLKKRLEEPDCQKTSVLLDGFPRTLQQANLLNEMGVEVKKFVHLKCPGEVLMQRACGRRIDVETKKAYHVDFDPPPEGVKVEHREDDKEEVVQKRLDHYEENHGDLCDFYKDVLIEVDAEKGSDFVFEVVTKEVEENLL